MRYIIITEEQLPTYNGSLIIRTKVYSSIASLRNFLKSENIRRKEYTCENLPSIKKLGDTFTTSLEVEYTS